MGTIYGKDYVLLQDYEDFVPKNIFDCGQCFRWNLGDDGTWTGVAKGRVLSITETQEGYRFGCTRREFEDVWINYFDLERDYAAVRKAISLDPFTEKAAQYGRGIRILNQDGWEALCSFIISQCNNITRIKGIVERLCAAFGGEINCSGKKYYTFPTVERVAGLNPEEISVIRAGFREKYILAAAEAVASGRVDLEQFEAMDTQECIRMLCTIKGVGIKVASCALLFGFGKQDAFPVDVWMKRALEQHYGGNAFDHTVFGDNSGIAQQYIFHYIRQMKGETA